MEMQNVEWKEKREVDREIENRKDRKKDDFSSLQRLWKLDCWVGTNEEGRCTLCVFMIWLLMKNDKDTSLIKANVFHIGNSKDQLSVFLLYLIYQNHLTHVIIPSF